MSQDKLSRLPKKREIAALVILYKKGRSIEYGTAIDFLRKELCTTKRTARNIIKRLKRIGALSLIKDGDSIVVVVDDPSNILFRLANSYIEKRRKKCRLELNTGSYQ